MPDYPEDYPDRLRINGRECDDIFNPTEKLYIRLRSVDPRTDRPDFGDIHCPGQSVNREKYSEPEDVLWRNSEFLSQYGFGYFTVAQVPEKILDGKGREVFFHVVHDPVFESDIELENYSHSEVRASNETGRAKSVSGLIKTVFRQTIAEQITVLRVPVRV